MSHADMSLQPLFNIHTIPSFDSYHHTMFQAVFDKLREADAHTHTVALTLNRLCVRDVAYGVATFATTLTGDMADLADVIDVMALLTPPPSPRDSTYVPSCVGEAFRYTDLPGSGNMYNARVIAIRGDQMDIRHTGRDIKYGRYTLSVPCVEFERCDSALATGSDEDEYTPPHTLALVTDEERMNFVLGRPPARGSAVECMKRIRV